MKNTLFLKDKTGRNALLFAMGFAILHGILTAPIAGGLLHWISLIPAAVAEAVLTLHAGPIASLVPPILSFGASLLCGAELPAALFSLCFFACGLVLALAMRTHMERLHAVAMLTVTCLLFFAERTLWEGAIDAVAAGAPDLLTFFREGIAEAKEAFLSAYRELYEISLKQYAQSGIDLGEFPETAVQQAINEIFAVLPGCFGVLLSLISVTMTYGMQFVSYMRGNSRAFAVTTWPYRISLVTAIGYVLLLLVSFWGDFSSSVFVACYNLFILLTPLLVIGELQTLPHFFREYRRLTGGKAPIFFILMTVLLFLLSPAYTLVGFALLYAVRVIKLALAARRSAK